MIRTAIYGAGAMGGVLGALIEKSGGKVDLYAPQRRTRTGSPRKTA